MRHDLAGGSIVVEKLLKRVGHWRFFLKIILVARHRGGVRTINIMPRHLALAAGAVLALVFFSALLIAWLVGPLKPASSQGELLAQQDAPPVHQLADNNLYAMAARLGELQAARQITVGLWAQPDLAMPGTVREVAAAADPTTRTYAARIRIDNPPHEVRLGMTARVALGGATESTLLVPLSAVIDLGQGPLVRVVKDGKVANRPVRVSRFREDGAELSGGLEAVELVIVSGAGKLVDGQEVQPKPATPPARQR